MKNAAFILILLFLSTSGIAQDSKLDSLLNIVNQFEDVKDYINAKILIEKNIKNFEHNWFTLSKELIYLNEKLGLYSENLKIFNEAHQKSYFYFIHPNIKKYEPYKQFKGFDSISKADINILRKTNLKSESIYEVQLPSNYDQKRKYPVILILHGGGSNIQKVKNHWQSKELNKNFIKVYVQSYRHFDSELYGWGSNDNKTINDFKNIYRDLKKNYNIDTTSIITGGISAAANPIFDLSLKAIIPVKANILFCPVIPSFLKEDQKKQIKNTNVKHYIITGENDNFLEKQKTAVHFLKSLNMEYKFTIIKNMGHQYPDNENKFIKKALKYSFK